MRERNSRIECRLLAATVPSSIPRHDLRRADRGASQKIYRPKRRYGNQLCIRYRLLTSVTPPTQLAPALQLNDDGRAQSRFRLGVGTVAISLDWDSAAYSAACDQSPDRVQFCVGTTCLQPLQCRHRGHRSFLHALHCREVEWQDDYSAR
jgi:hypothetical protein